MSEIEDIRGMGQETWRDRLAAALKKSGKSKREVSLSAGMGAGYVHSILKDGKDPTLAHLITVCDKVGVSLSYVVFGFDVSAENERILQKLQGAPPQMREGIEKILEDQDP